MWNQTAYILAKKNDGMNSLSNIPRQYYGQNTYKSKQASLGCRKGSSDLEDFSMLRAIEPSKW